MVLWCAECGKAFEVDVLAMPRKWFCRGCREPSTLTFDFGSNASRHSMPDGYPPLLLRPTRRGDPCE
ncbi:MAG: hypothetical protein F4Y03_11340 [Alphaproteobacteria bacterium]|nr:hypothetical protein [Alphaproteobacteria bacterium]